MMFPSAHPSQQNLLLGWQQQHHQPYPAPRHEPSPAPPANAPRPPWGEPTWTFLHVLAERVDEWQFGAARDELIHTVRTVCANLPCPDCAGHAQAFLARADTRGALLSKDHFRYFLCGFHNTVNARLGRPPFNPQWLGDTFAAHDFPRAASRMLRAWAAAAAAAARSGVGPLPGSFARSRAVAALQEWCSQRGPVLFSPPPPALEAQDYIAVDELARQQQQQQHP